MKKSLTKLIVSCAAVASIATAMAVSASAATYENGTLTPGIKSAAADGKQATVLVYEASKAEDEATAENIRYIDQQTMAADLWNTISLTLDADKTYVIKMGGEGAEVASELLGKKTETIKVKVGDVTDDGNINAKDSLAILMYAVKDADVVTMIDGSAKAKRAADVVNDEKINAKDSLAILMHAVKDESVESLFTEVEIPAE